VSGSTLPGRASPADSASETILDMSVRCAGMLCCCYRLQHSAPTESEFYHVFLRRFSAEFGGWNGKQQ